MRLKKLNLENFKGLNFELTTNGNTTNVYGANESGKSRLFDAYTFLMFGKDSLDQADFDIKNIEDGKTKHGLEHSVKAEFEDPNISLKRIYLEKWPKKRGSSKRVFEGHTTKYEINGVPNKKLKQFKDTVNSICDDKTFRLLTDPKYFHTELSWKDRRDILVEMVGGEITNEDVIAAFPELSEFNNILKDKTADDAKEIIKSRQKAINEDIKELPTRIDEANKGYGATRAKTEIQSDLHAEKNYLADCEQTLKEIKAGGESEVLTSELRKVENQIQDLDNKEAAEKLKIQQDRNKERQELQKAINDINHSIEDNKKSLNRIIDDKNSITRSIEKFSEQADRLRKEWHTENSKEFEYDESSTCPQCGYDLLKKDKILAQETFNKTKAMKLDYINKDGKELVEQINFKEKKVKGLDEKIEQINDSLNKLNQSRSEAEKALKDFDEQQKTDEPENPERTHLLKEKENLEQQIKDKKDTVDPEAVKEGETQIQAIEIRIERYNKELLQIEANKRIDVRIQELSDQERKLSAEYENLERQLFIVEDFLRKKAQMLEGKINKKFNITQWSLGEDQINEGWKDNCVAIQRGVPYRSMSHSQRMKVGLDTINTLCEYYQQWPVIFIDDADLITEIPKTKSQQIRLIVSPKDKTLRIE